MRVLINASIMPCYLIHLLYLRLFCASMGFVAYPDYPVWVVSPALTVAHQGIYNASAYFFNAAKLLKQSTLLLFRPYLFYLPFVYELYSSVFVICNVYPVIAVICIEDITHKKIEPVYTTSFVLHIFLYFF